jgi:hypothetical protein
MARSLRNRLSLEGRELGVWGVVGDRGGTLIVSEGNKSSSNSTFGTMPGIINKSVTDASILILTGLLIWCIYCPAGFTPKGFEIKMRMQLIYQYLPQGLNSLF